MAIAFFSILFAAMDLGRYFVTQHSLRTLTSELARATLTYCAQSGASYTTACSLPAAGAQSVASAKAKVPFLTSTGSFVGTPSATRSAANAAGVVTITASAAHDFNFVLPVLVGLSGTISESTTLKTY